MFTNKKFIRAIAIFLLINFLFDIYLPTITYALTAGPTAPEATSFEPVDTTDMVNLLSGDFTYNIPLIEVPGPEGGYPLSLSYHAGIKPDLEASWVGLGWTLNPGAINRFVNNYPDDCEGEQVTDHVFWEGGKTTTASIGISVGIGEAASVNAGLVFAHDTYKGFGVGVSIGAGVGFGKKDSNVGYGVSASVGINPFGGAYASAGTNLGIGLSEKESSSTKLGIGLGFNTNGGFGGGAGLSFSEALEGYDKPLTHSLLGISMSSNAVKPNMSVGGMTISVNNSKAGNISTSTSGFSADIPIIPGINISLGFQKTRYWIDEKLLVSTYGSLYYPKSPNGDFEVLAFDSKDIKDLSHDGRFDEEEYTSDPDIELGGVLPTYDDYYVQAQGVSGSIQPYLIQKSFYRQTILKDINNDGSADDLTCRGVDISVDEEYLPNYKFRFANEFSNKLLLNQTSLIADINGITNSFQDPISGDDNISGIQNQNKIIGSKNVEWFSNLNIADLPGYEYPDESGFLDCTRLGFVRDNENLDDPILFTITKEEYFKYIQFRSTIGGFMITNESGMNYHFALPAFSSNERVRSETIDDEETGEYYHELDRPSGYPYTWYLTTITGPDYLDANNNRIADEGDWGYWVAFDYGFWKNMNWRNPATGYNKDVDDNIQSYSRGSKQLYYLNAIRTNSHTALFFKEERLDGRGVADMDIGTFTSESAKTLRLDEIVLIKNEDLKNTLAQPSVISCIEELDKLGDLNLPGYGNNVLDVSDLSVIKQNQNFIANTIKAIKFNHSYDLCPGTLNSFPDERTILKEGKLTLNSVQTFGKKYSEVIPPVNFDYKVEDPNCNPSYYSTRTDFWGYYKTDAVNSDISESIKKRPTSVSAKKVDAWSLRSIKSPLGSVISVEYESDSYRKSTLNNSFPFVIESFENIENDNQRFKINVKWEESKLLDNFLYKGDNLNPIIFGNIKENDVLKNAYIKDYSDELPDFTIESIYDNQLTIISSQKDDLFSSEMENGILITKEPTEGNFGIHSSGARYGGGIRVKEIKIEDPITGRKRSTMYDYNIPGTDISSGVTSYEPVTMDKNDEEFEFTTRLVNKSTFESHLARNFSKLLNESSQIPAPGVMYEYVTVSEKTSDKNDVEHLMPNKSTYQHIVYDDDKYLEFNYSNTAKHDIQGSIFNKNYKGIQTRELEIKNYTNLIGELKKVTLYNKDNIKISETNYHFLHNQITSDSFSEYEDCLKQSYNGQGIMQEEYADAKLVLQRDYTLVGHVMMWVYNYYLKGIKVKYEKYPVVKTGVTNINYRTGITTSSTNLAFDFFSGDVTESIYKDAIGNEFLTVEKPAYRLSQYAGMGMKGIDIDNANMLTQKRSTEVYKVNNNYRTSRNSSDILGLNSANVQTWSNTINVLNVDDIETYPYSENVKQVWRKCANYSWIGDETLNSNGLYPAENLVEFDAWNRSEQPSDQRWQKNTEILLYDMNSNALEAIDLNGNYVATRTDLKHERVMSTIINSRYCDFTYSGIEENYNGNLGGDVFGMEGLTVVTGISHTGEKSIFISSSNNRDLLFQLKDPLKNSIYRISFWATSPNVGISSMKGSPVVLEYQSVEPDPSKMSNGWYLINYDYHTDDTGDPILLNVATVGQGGIYFDDFRIHPIDAKMISYVYNKWGELTDILDENNISTHFEYDDMGRLKSTYRETFKHGLVEINEHKINYARSISDQ